MAISNVIANQLSSVYNKTTEWVYTVLYKHQRNSIVSPDNLTLGQKVKNRILCISTGMPNI